MAIVRQHGRHEQARQPRLRRRTSWRPAPRGSLRAAAPTRIRPTPRPGPRTHSLSALQPAHGGRVRPLDAPLREVPRTAPPARPWRGTCGAVPHAPVRGSTRCSVHASPGSFGPRLSLSQSAESGPALAGRHRSAGSTDSLAGRSHPPGGGGRLRASGRRGFGLRAAALRRRPASDGGTGAAREGPGFRPSRRDRPSGQGWQGSRRECCRRRWSSH